MSDMTTRPDSDQSVVVYEGRAGWGWRIVENGRTVQASTAWHVSEVSARIVAEYNARKRVALDERQQS